MATEAQTASVGSRSLCPEAPFLSLSTQRLLLKAWLVGTDAFVLGFAFLVAYWMRFDLQMTTAPEVVAPPYFYEMVAALLTSVLILLFLLFNLYDHDSLLGGVSEYSRIFNACSTGAMVVVFASFLAPGFVVSRGWLVAAWLLSFVMVTLNRFVCRRLVYPLRRRGYFLTPAVIIGINEEAAALAADLRNWGSSGLRIAGFVSSEPDAGRRLGLPVLGDVGDIRRIIRQHGIEDLIVAITALRREQLLELCEEINSVPGVHLRLSSGLYELLTTGLTVRTNGSVPLVTVNKMRLTTGEAFSKAVLEYSLSIVGLLLLWPLLLLLAILIKWDSRGPVLFRRRVLGVSGRRFNAFKFRTMHVNGDDLLGPDRRLQEQLRLEHKLKDDPRVTHVGRWLRKYSLDELPQLFNVILGQMALVGPRMITSEEAEKYGRHRLDLLTVKPGITGLWQVSGRSDLSYEERVRLDMYYIRNYSVWLDLQVLFVQTLPAVIRGRGAY